MADISAGITGDEDLYVALRGFSAAVSGSVKAELMDSARMIVNEAQSRVPRRTGAARASLDVENTPAGAEIVAGGRRAPYYGWLDFGGRTGRKNSVLRAYVANGRYLYPAVTAGLTDIQRAAEQGVKSAGEKAGVTVHG